MYHQEMIPTQLLNSAINAKQQVPFPTSIEVLAMLVAFELLQEAGLRLPTPVGDTVSIIGALIVGQSAVDAHRLGADSHVRRDFRHHGSDHIDDLAHVLH